MNRTFRTFLSYLVWRTSIGQDMVILTIVFCSHLMRECTQRYYHFIFSLLWDEHHPWWCIVFPLSFGHRKIVGSLSHSQILDTRPNGDRIRSCCESDPKGKSRHGMVFCHIFIRNIKIYWPFECSYRCCGWCCTCCPP